jgi:hypothetical protein
MTPVKIPSAQSIMMPEWQKAAGGKMAFEVISLRRSEPGAFTPANMNITTADSFHPIGGLFSADFPLATYIEFAYKLLLTP